MNFLIVTHVEHAQKDANYFAYAPYVKEMNLWLKYVDNVTIVSPLLTEKEIRPIDIDYEHDQIDFKAIPAFNLLSVKSSLKTLLVFQVSSLESFLPCEKQITFTCDVLETLV